MEYTSALETHEGFSNALATHGSHLVVVRATVYPVVKVRESQDLLMAVNKAPASLYADCYACHIDGIHKYSRDP